MTTLPRPAQSFTWGTLLLFAFVLALPACAPKSASTTNTGEVAPVPVTVTPVSFVELQRTVPVFGTLHAQEDVLLAPKVDGRVVRTLKQEGELVRPGEVLLELDETDYANAIAQARPAFEGELRKLKLAQLPDSDELFLLHLTKVDSVAQARATFELAEKELARAEFENSRGVGSAQILDSSRTRVKVAQTGVDLAETEARVTLANARRLKAILDDARDRLRETKLFAPVPFDCSVYAAVLGYAATPLRYSVAARMVSQGEMIRSMPVTNAYRLVMDHILKLHATVPEKHKPEVKVGMPVKLFVEAYPGRTFPGTVARVFPTVDPSNRTFVAEVEVPNWNRALSTGGFAKAEILTRTDSGVLTVPLGAVVSFAGVNKVFIAEGNTARAVEVSLGLRDKEWVEVTGALKAGDRVITSGQTQLVDGAAIRIR